MLVAAVVPLALMAVAATSYVVFRADEVVAAGIGCYESANVDSSNVTVVESTGADPIEVCAELWAEGDITGSTASPHLTACINEGGAVAVLPSSDETICTRSGLQPLPEGYREAARRFAAMRDDVYRELYEIGTTAGVDEKAVCLTEDTALRTVNSVLDDHGFHDWTAEINEGDYQDRTCMNAVAFEDAEKRVLIIPSEPGIIPWHRDPTM